MMNLRIHGRIRYKFNLKVVVFEIWNKQTETPDTKVRGTHLSFIECSMGIWPLIKLYQFDIGSSICLDIHVIEVPIWQGPLRLFFHYAGKTHHHR
mgnify:CR=1 FL=1